MVGKARPNRRQLLVGGAAAGLIAGPTVLGLALSGPDGSAPPALAAPTTTTSTSPQATTTEHRPSTRTRHHTASTSSYPPHTPDAPPPTSANAPTDVPVRRPAIAPGTIALPHGGRARLVRKHTGADGTLPIPSNVDDAAWWGAGIGEPGAMLLSGHVNFNGAVGPFNELWRAARGDKVIVDDSRGVKHRYRVSRVLTLSKKQLPKQAPTLFAQTGPPRLVLVTCGGRFVGGDEGYDQNRVVVARPA